MCLLCLCVFSLRTGSRFGWVLGEIDECSLGRAGRAEGGPVRRECTGEASPASHSLRSRSHVAPTSSRSPNLFSDLAGSLFAGYCTSYSWLRNNLSWLVFRQFHGCKCTVSLPLMFLFGSWWNAFSNLNPVNRQAQLINQVNYQPRSQGLYLTFLMSDPGNEVGKLHLSSLKNPTFQPDREVQKGVY